MDARRWPRGLQKEICTSVVINNQKKKNMKCHLQHALQQITNSIEETSFKEFNTIYVQYVHQT